MRALGDLVVRGCPSACWPAWTCPSRSGPSGRGSRPSSRPGRRRGGSPAPRCGRAGSGSPASCGQLLLPSSTGWTRSARVMSFRVRTIDPWTRVHSSLVGQGSCALAGADEHAVGVGGDALDRARSRPRARHHLGHGDLAGGAGQRVAAVRAAARLDEPGLAQALHEVLEVGERQALGVGDRAERDRAGSPSSPARGAPSRARRTRLWWRTSSSAQILPGSRRSRQRFGLRAAAGRAPAARAWPRSPGSPRAGSRACRRA